MEELRKNPKSKTEGELETPCFVANKNQIQEEEDAPSSRMTFGLDDEKNELPSPRRPRLPSKFSLKQSPKTPTQQNKFMDTSCSIVSGDREDIFSLNNSVMSNRLNFTDSVQNLLPHEKFPHKEETPNDKELRQLNFFVNKQYDKKGLKDKISKPSLWDALVLLTTQVAKKGDDKNRINMRRDTAKFHNPVIPPRPKQKPEDFIKILAEYLNRMLKKRKKQKLKK